VKKLVGIISTLPLGWALSQSAVVHAQEAPSKQFIQRDVPLAWIFDEWYRKSGTQIPMFACVCVNSFCDIRAGWPFREFSIGQAIPALGPTNRANAERNGFVCGEIPASEFPLRGIGG